MTTTTTTDPDLTVRVPVLLADAVAAARALHPDMDRGMRLAVDSFLAMGFADDQTAMPVDEAYYRARVLMAAALSLLEALGMAGEVGATLDDARPDGELVGVCFPHVAEQLSQLAEFADTSDPDSDP